MRLAACFHFVCLFLFTIPVFAQKDPARPHHYKHVHLVTKPREETHKKQVGASQKPFLVAKTSNESHCLRKSAHYKTFKTNLQATADSSVPATTSQEAHNYKHQFRLTSRAGRETSVNKPAELATK